MKAKTKQVVHWFAIFMAVVVILGLGIGVWVLAKKVTYAFGYKNQVEQTVCEMVVAEYLRNPDDCK